LTVWCTPTSSSIHHRRVIVGRFVEILCAKAFPEAFFGLADLELPAHSHTPTPLRSMAAPSRGHTHSSRGIRRRSRRVLLLLCVSNFHAQGRLVEIWPRQNTSPSRSGVVRTGCFLASGPEQPPSTVSKAPIFTLCWVQWSAGAQPGIASTQCSSPAGDALVQIPQSARQAPVSRLSMLGLSHLIALCNAE
jgi:hypothetical protein